MTRKRNFVLAGASIAAMALAATSLHAQQPTKQQQPSQAQQQPADQKGQAAGDLRSVIGTLELARDGFQGTPLPQAVQRAENAVEQAARTLQGMAVPASQKTEAMQSIEQSRQVLAGSTVDPQRARQSLDRTIGVLRSVQPQQAAGGTNQGGTPGGQSGAQDGATVRRPQITVQQQPADIQVTQPQPQITVTQPRPDVQITQPQPQVSVQMPEPQVKVQQAQPNVNVQRSGEPNVEVVRPQGSQAMTGTATGAAQGRDTTPGTATGAAGAQSGATVVSPIAAMGRTIVGRTVYGAAGNEIADIEDVVVGPGGTVEAVLMDVGGFLGIGEKRVAVPLNRLRMQNDRVTTDLTAEQARDLPAHRG